MELINVMYLFFRLSPFVIVCYFSLQSFFNSDIKGFIYLVGLLIASVSTIVLGSLITSDDSVDRNELCKTMTIGGNDKPLSNLPLSQTVFGYSFAYLSYFIVKYNLQSQNIPTFIFFPLLSISDGFWNWNYECLGDKSKTMFKIITSLVTGMLIGVLWATIIASTNVPNLQYMNGIGNKEVCGLPSKSMFKCIKKTAKV